MLIPESTKKQEDINRWVAYVVNGQIDFFDNFRAKIIDVADTGTADTEFTVTHNLGRIPTGYIWNTSKSGVVYDSSRGSWTEIILKLKCSAANAVLKLVVF